MSDISFHELGIVMAGIFVEVPAGLLLLVSIIVSLVLRRRPATKASRLYATVVLSLVPVLVLAGPVAAFVFEGEFVMLFFGFFLLVFSPAALMGVVSAMLAFQLRKHE